MRWSWNINGMNVPNWTQLVEWGKQVKPSWVLIMDNLDRARYWKDNVGGEVIYRVWDVRDGYYHQHVRPQDASEQLARELGDNRDLWAYYRLNEPGGNWGEIQNWIIEFAKSNKAKGIKTTSQGLAIMKNWHTPEWVQAGHVDDLIRYADENRDTFILDVHEYTTGFAWSDHTPNYPANLFDLDLSRSGENNAVINWHDYNPEFTNWYMGRVLWVSNIRAKELELEPLPFIITEGIFDWHSSVHQQPITIGGKQTTVGQELRERYGDDRFDREVKGVLGSRNLFAWLQTGDAKAIISDELFAEIVMRNFKWIEDNYPPNCKGIMLFTMNPDWRFPSSSQGGGFGHDYIPIANALLPKMKTLVTTNNPPDIPDENPMPDEIVMIPQTIRAVDERVRIRQKPTIVNSLQLGWIEPLWIDALVSDKTWIEDGYIWHKVQYKDVTGYAAFEIVNGGELVDIQENDDVPEPDTVVMSRADFEALKAIIEKYDT